MSAGPPSSRVALAAVASIIALSVGVAVEHSTLPGRTASPVGETGTRPNMILILTDDQRWDSLWAMPHVRTLLAGHGVTFRNAFVTTSVCCPSRAGLLTGRYSRHTGVYADLPPNGGAISFDDSSTLATWVQGAGYTTGFVGKYLNDYQRIAHHIPPGWDEWAAISSQPTAKYFDFTLNENGTFREYGSRRSDYSTSVLGRIATRFLRTARPPFFLHFAPIAPHPPAVSPERDRRRFYLQPISSPSFDEADLSDKPWAALRPPLSLARTAEALAIGERMIDSLQAVDREVAAMVRVLADRGQLDNTVIVFTSDNGYLLGEHRLFFQTVWPYEESIRVPLVVRTPWSTAPSTSDHLALNLDLAPTLAQMAGVVPDPPPDGRSLVPLLRGERTAWRSAFVEEFLGRDQRFNGGPPPFDAIRTTRYLYVEYRTGWRELYDLRTDPYELENLAGRAAYASVTADLARSLRRLVAA